MRVTNCQNLVFRDLSQSQLPVLHQRLDAIGMAEPGAELARDVVACPGADTRIEFGQKALRLPAHNAPDAVVRVVGRFAAERAAGEDFRTWLDRVGGPEAADDGRCDLDHFPSPDEYPEYYVDFGETGPYVAEIGDSECAT